MASFKGAISVDIERCKGCGVCVVNCPMNVISLAKEVNGKGYNYAYLLLTVFRPSRKKPHVSSRISLI